MKFSKFNSNKFYCKFATILLIFGCVFSNTMQKPLEHMHISCFYAGYGPCGRSKPLCTRNSMGIYPHPENSNRYVKCVGKKTYIFSCGENSVFDGEHKICITYAGDLKYS